MSSFREKLARAQNVQRPYATETVALPSGFSQEREDLLAEIASAALDPRMSANPAAKAKKRLAEIEDVEIDSLVTVKLYLTAPEMWANLSSNAGYALPTTCKAAIMVDGVILDGEEEITQSPEEWDAFLKLLSPTDYQALIALAFKLNDKEPADRTERLKKALAGTPASDES